jgi:hypothetical protein
VRSGRTHAGDRVGRARAQYRILGDQRAVEVAGEGGDTRRESSGELYGGVPPVDLTTNAATSAICWSESWPLKAGIDGPPSVT